MFDVLIIGGPHDGERHEINGAYPSISLPVPGKDDLGFPMRRPTPEELEKVPELTFEVHDYQIVPLYGHYLGIHSSMRTDQALAALVRRYPVP